jgi:hypothetical protein
VGATLRYCRSSLQAINLFWIKIEDAMGKLPVIGRVKGRWGLGSLWSCATMNVLREHSGFPNLIAGTLNVLVTQTCDFRVDVRVSPDDFTPDNLQRQELSFEFCQLSSKGKSVRALCLIRGGNELEFMAEHRIRELLSVQDGDEIQIQFYDTREEVMAATRMR